jgi:hypothetical protein
MSFLYFLKRLRISNLSKKWGQRHSYSHISEYNQTGLISTKDSRVKYLLLDIFFYVVKFRKKIIALFIFREGSVLIPLRVCNILSFKYSNIHLLKRLEFM